MNRLLDHARPAADQAVQELDLKHVPLRLDIPQPRSPELLRPYGLKPRGAVGNPLQAAHPPGQPVPPPREKPSPQVPALIKGTPLDVAAPDSHVGTVGNAPKQPPRVVRVVREVRVHLHHDIGAENIHRMGDSAHVSVPQSSPLPLEQMDAPVRPGSKPPDKTRRAVGAPVVDDKKRRVRIPVELRKLPEQQSDVKRLVVRRDNEAHPCVVGAQSEASREAETEQEMKLSVETLFPFNVDTLRNYSTEAGKGSYFPVRR